MLDHRDVEEHQSQNHPMNGGDWQQSKPQTRLRKRTPRRLALGCLKLSIGIAALALVAAAVLIVRLNVGPLAIDGIGDKISTALNQRVGRGLKFTLGQTSIVQRGLGPSLKIDKLAVTGKDGAQVLVAPKAEISIDPFALMIGRVVPKRLEVFDVTLRLVALKDGNLAITAGATDKPLAEIGGQGDAGAAPPIATQPPDAGSGHKPVRSVAMAQAATALRQFMDVLTDPGSVIAAVDRLGISRGTLVIQDQETNEQTTYTDFDIAFDRHYSGTSFDVSAQGPSRRWSINAIASGSPGSERHFSLKAKDLSIDEIELALGSRSIGVDTDMPLAAHLDLGLRANNTLSEASGGIDGGAGYFRTSDPDQEPILLTTLGADFKWNGEARQIELTSLRYVEGETHITGAGSVVPPRTEDDPWAIKLTTNGPALLAPDRKGQQPITITSGVINGRLLVAQKLFLIDQASLATSPGGIAARGQIDWVNGPHIRLGASIAPTPVATVKRVWPAFMAAPVRAWMIEHFESGIIEHGVMQIDYDENDLDRMRADRSPKDHSAVVDFDVREGRVSFLDGVPPLDHVVGKVHITGRTSQFNVASGTIDANGDPISLSDGSFSIGNSNVHPVDARVQAHLSGSVQAVAYVLSRDAIKPYASIPLDPATLSGKVDGTLDKTIFLGSDDESKNTMAVSAKVTNFKAERLLGKENLEDADVDISVGDGKLKAAGQGKMFGAPATFEIDRVGFGTPSANVALTLDDAARARLGLSAVEGITGPVVAHVSTTLGDPAKMKAQIELDFAKAGINAAYLGLSKPVGRPGKVAFTLASGPNKMIVDPITADIGSLQARGSIDLNPDNSFQGAHFSSFKVSPGDEMKLDVSKADDTFKLTIRGSNIDGRPFLKAVTSTPANEGTPTSRSAKSEKREADSFKGYDVDLKSAILTGFNKEVMTGAELKLSKRGGTFKQFNVSGKFGDKTLSATTTPAQRIRITTTDAGALLSFIDLYKHMEDGSLVASLQMDGDQMDGALDIRNFILRDEPAIRRLVAQSTEVSAPGADTAAAKRINAGAVRFNQLKVKFERQGSHLDLHDAAMSGPDIGLSVDGWLDYSHDQVDMKGTFVPAYALNNLFSQIPVFGLFLGGKSDEGLLAITFRITGLVSSPTLSINPLSAIAPGILRNIFGALDDAAYRQQSGAPPSR